MKDIDPMETFDMGYHLYAKEKHNKELRITQAVLNMLSNSFKTTI